ncbi:hypothetical protein [Halobacillus campisalis]|uniref:ABC transporter permease n=1 Tax=Halobacillus campisalis TaxID=435909 RepID=A0ABW2K406_9BACI|nr:hypothetical protein [Halobacillus campisalis]
MAKASNITSKKRKKELPLGHGFIWPIITLIPIILLASNAADDSNYFILM